ncbi:MAG: hypothetical protein MZW92_15970 [Comamonadaceae bacterium]|nr:hypothetical protein [Comamonadaceae bacterium]
MRDEYGRAVPPGAFLPTVERYNLSVRYDRWVIGTALQVDAGARAGHRAACRASSSTCRATRSSIPRPRRLRPPARSRRRASTRAGSASRWPRRSRSANLTQANQLFGDLRRIGCAVEPRRLRQRRVVVRLPEGARRRLPEDRRHVRRQHLAGQGRLRDGALDHGDRARHGQEGDRRVRRERCRAREARARSASTTRRASASASRGPSTKSPLESATCCR